MIQPQAPLVCEVCGARVSNLRRGRCWICYIRWAETRPVGSGAACVVCNDRRLDNLRLMEFQNAWVPMCHNCGTRALKLSPMPHSIEGLRQRLNRDRRWSDRRGFLPEARLSRRERRVGERRAEALPEGEGVYDIDELIIEIELPEDAMEEGTLALTHIAEPAESA